jgi:hypothetical protein
MREIKITLIIKMKRRRVLDQLLMILAWRYGIKLLRDSRFSIEAEKLIR